MLERILEVYPEDTFLVADGFNDAIIGVDESTMRLIYSVEKCIDILVENDEMLLEQAIEYFDFNVRGAYVGEQTPIFCDDTF
jgi:chaperone required for assembly of F1-ATPase